MKTYWVIMALVSWDQVELRRGHFKAGIEKEGPDGSVGFLPVFNSKEEAECVRNDLSSTAAVLQITLAVAVEGALA